MASRNYKTAKGTELPLLNLRGKDYLEVKFRLVWFREDHPDWSIETELMNVTDVSAYARATIRDEKGRIIATSHKFENSQGFPDFIEKSETGAIGRALALIGYGTQFCADELDEGKRIVDAPAQPPRRTAPSQQQGQNQNRPVAQPQQQKAEAKNFGSQTQQNTVNATQHEAMAVDIGEDEPLEEEANTNISEPGEYQISFGRKYKGRKLKDIPRTELEGYLQWLESNALREGTALSYQVKFLKDAFDRMYAGNTMGATAGSSISEASH